MPLEAFYLPTDAGPRFCTLARPAPSQACRGTVLFVHAFAEEMNKSRRMVALQARDLAAAGYLVLQMDLHGCGDSSGDFGDASWASWVEDVLMAVRWLKAHQTSNVWLWGLRTGCLLICEAARHIDEPVKLLFWQPVLSGKQFLQQFFRLQTAGEMLGKEEKGSAARLREQVAAGNAVEIAGYQLSPALVNGLEQAELMPPIYKGELVWLQVASKADSPLPPNAQSSIEHWRNEGHVVQAASVGGPAFWQTTEISDCPALLTACTTTLQQAGGMQ
ncbi:hydrolase 2, exosortase A system-associated [Chitinimonas sp. BJB300]|uniref:hydrolase 2, exosortase A system-associated n=1 Tax=Chitinimonas sp. BJB300 TaxID=1559339 RepID=UPI000C0E59AA|nr:hydrolase 2, exosortase A system-associated [Chitinimonas sp. BJB300]PHV13356.1 hydrolase 2, exosortase A system-associated [Chitinimonas sp. BJB300]TSJ85271.1 hydrolase 2, exosortase A system-associated [Chitinimonas sp. BJB300]